jgi:hypothetical protein
VSRCLSKSEVADRLAENTSQAKTARKRRKIARKVHHFNIRKLDQEPEKGVRGAENEPDAKASEIRRRKRKERKRASHAIGWGPSRRRSFCCGLPASRACAEGPEQAAIRFWSAAQQQKEAANSTKDHNLVREYLRNYLAYSLAGCDEL